jgi:hypothetical protein
VGRKGLEAPPAGPRVGSTHKVANPVPQTPIWIDDKEVTEDMNIDETENSPRVPGRKRARDLEGIEGDDLFSEELDSQLFNQGGRQNDKLVVDDMGFKEEREKSVITQCKETLKESLEKLSALQQFISQVKREIEQAVIEELTDLGLKKNDEIENAVSPNEWSWRGDVDSAGSVTYQLYHEVNGKTSNSEPVYHACLNYRDLKNGDRPMLNFAAQTSVRKAMCSYTQKSLIAETDDRLQRKVRR